MSPKAQHRAAWHALSREDKQQRLESMRRRQQAQVQVELLRLGQFR